jgi:hypothetical protein
MSYNTLNINLDVKYMIEKNAFELVQQYITGWKQNNLQLIISCLAENCIVIESHGPVYHGIHEIDHWFKFWLAAKSTVLKWDILSLSFCEKEQIELGKYQHYKTGNLYQVLGITRHSETLEDMVIYQALYHCKQFGDHQIWVRRKKMFLDYVVHDGRHVPRFKQIKE